MLRGSNFKDHTTNLRRKCKQMKANIYKEPVFQQGTDQDTFLRPILYEMTVYHFRNIKTWWHTPQAEMKYSDCLERSQILCDMGIMVDHQNNSIKVGLVCRCRIDFKFKRSFFEVLWNSWLNETGLPANMDTIFLTRFGTSGDPEDQYLWWFDPVCEKCKMPIIKDLNMTDSCHK